ncbi:helix-turn-helix domain-containing protein [Alicyclobacillus sendaiensis]|uniref:helix-turn-helix domain-containing protein n=1 Tax=Alicyclobacillus sendaiensis TaxID=192387 RepID=UPI00018A6C33|nr:helix-turn-helix transcriptional regulator [Alicyclobacillus sendaiensis]
MKRKPKGHIILRLLREAAGLSQVELGMEIGADRNVVSRIEAGQDIDPQTLQRWVDVCGGMEMLDWLIEHMRALRRYLHLLTRTDYHAYA